MWKKKERKDKGQKKDGRKEERKKGKKEKKDQFENAVQRLYSLKATTQIKTCPNFPPFISSLSLNQHIGK